MYVDKFSKSMGRRLNTELDMIIITKKYRLSFCTDTNDIYPYIRNLRGIFLNPQLINVGIKVILWNYG